MKGCSKCICKEKIGKRKGFEIEERVKLQVIPCVLSLIKYAAEEICSILL